MPRQWWHKLDGVTEDPTQADPTYQGGGGGGDEGQSLPWLRHHLECTYHVIAISAGWPGRSSSPAHQSSTGVSHHITRNPLRFLRAFSHKITYVSQTAVFARLGGCPFPRGEWSERASRLVAGVL